MRILVAEDDIELSEQIKHALSNEGHAIDLASDGEEAKFLGETEPYDLIVLDLGLPVQDGITILKAWRDDSPRSAHAPTSHLTPSGPSHMSMGSGVRGDVPEGVL